MAILKIKQKNKIAAINTKGTLGNQYFPFLKYDESRGTSVLI
jgi:hypothetical protein